MPALNKLKSTLLVCSGGLSVFSALSIYNGSEPFHEKFVLPLVHKLDPETSHNIALTAAKFGLIGQSKFKDPDSLRTKVWQLNFSNPLGIAAGFDKQGEAVEGLHKIGLGFVEVGSVTPFPQPGNDKPRVFRLEKDEAIINRYGFNSEGHDVVYDRLKKVRSRDDFKGVIGVNLGKNRLSDDPVGDYVKGIKKFGDVADYLVINISSPNTPGLRTWQKKQQLRELLTGLVAARDELPGPKKPPLLLKLAPDLTQEERKDIASVLQDKKCTVDGLVISNTTVERLPSLQSENVGEEGGLSGRPLSEPSTRLIEDMYKLTKGQIPIIGVGGIFSGRDAYEKIRAGASLIQLYTSFIYHGPPRVTRIKKELDEHLRC
ncbi:dihydroorotate dehydrogenase (quinone), mitochondrial isoform X3 [Anabrus simplex]|uniref:dihydroorotate dehydrogenase (quinone), mitochondrial isoform X3 n=1 Tax=Anabrus simplex TaxID=316456 RepID=UPI0035A3B50A